MQYTKIIIISGENEIGLLSQVIQHLAQYDINVCDIGQSLILSSLSIGLMVSSDSDCFAQAVTSLQEKVPSTIKIKTFDVTSAPHKTTDGTDKYAITLMGSVLTAYAMSKVIAVLAKFNLDIQNIHRLSKESSPYICLEIIALGTIKDISVLQRMLFMAGEDTDLDIACQADGLYRKHRRLVVFDMDSTLIEQEVIDELADQAGVLEEVSRITKQAMEGKLDFKQSLIKRASLLKGLDISICEEVYNKITLTSGAQKLITTIQSIGYKTAIISGGFDYFSQRLQQMLNMDYQYANRLEIVDGKLTGRLLGEIIDGARKAEIMCEIVQKERLCLEQVIAVGDGANDIPMLSVAGLGISFRAKPKVRDQAHYNISIIGLEGILYMLGLQDR